MSETPVPEARNALWDAHVEFIKANDALNRAERAVDRADAWLLTASANLTAVEEYADSLGVDTEEARALAAEHSRLVNAARVAAWKQGDKA